MYSAISIMSNSLQPHVTHQATLSMGFSRQEYRSALPALLQGIFLTQGLNPGVLSLLPCRQILYCGATGEAHRYMIDYATDCSVNINNKDVVP